MGNHGGLPQRGLPQRGPTGRHGGLPQRGPPQRGLPQRTPQPRGRRSIRLPGFDYSRSGAYFVTMVAEHRFCAFGAIADGEMRMNVIGEMVQSVWDEIPAHYPGVDVETAVVMPNHFHGIIVLLDDDVVVGAGAPACPIDGNGQPRGVAPTGAARTAGAPACPVDARTRVGTDGNGQPRGVAPTDPPTGAAPKRLSLPDVVHRFKSLTTARYRAGVKQYAWPDFPGHFWERNYYEHVIREAADLKRIRDYIANNPAQWDRDRFHVDGARRTG